MFRKDSIPQHVKAFGRELAEKFVEFDATNTYTTEVMRQKFYSACEEVNQKLIGKFKNALPITDIAAKQDEENNIIMMRVIQVKHQDCYVLEIQFWVKAQGCFKVKKWYQLTDEGLHLQSKIFDVSRRYEFRCIGRNFSVPEEELTVKDFYYKL